MGDCLRAGKTSRYTTSCLGQLSLPTLQGRQIDYWFVCLGLRWNAFTHVGWQVAVCDPIWQVTLCSYVKEFLVKKQFSLSLSVAPWAQCPLDVGVHDKFYEMCPFRPVYRQSVDLVTPVH